MSGLRVSDQRRCVIAPGPLPYPRTFRAEIAERFLTALDESDWSERVCESLDPLHHLVHSPLRGQRRPRDPRDDPGDVVIDPADPAPQGTWRQGDVDREGV